MTLDKDDLKELGELIENSLDNRLGKNLEKVGYLIDTKMINFHNTVTEPMMDNVIDSLRTEFTSQVSRVERKLDNITDMLTDKVSDHEKRIIKIEAVVSV